MTANRSVAPRSSGVALLCCAALWPALSSAGAKPSGKPKVDGFWDAPGGRISLTNDKGHVTGVLTSAASGVDLKPDEKVLDGTLDEDNLSADVRLGVVAPGCNAKKGTAFAVLLVTRSGKLTGGVSAKARCAADLSSVTLTRSKQADAGTDGSKPAMVGEPAPAGQYDPRGRRTVPLIDSVKGLLTDGQQYMNEGQFEQARAQFQKALAKDPNVGETYNGIGATYAIRNDYESAVDWYKRGLEAAPGFGDLYYNLACAYAQESKPKLALRFLKLAASKGYAEIAALDEDHDLDPIRNDPDFALIRSVMQPAGGTAPSPTPPPAPLPSATSPANSPGPADAVAPGTMGATPRSSSPDTAPQTGGAGPAPITHTLDAAPGATPAPPTGNP